MKYTIYLLGALFFLNFQIVEDHGKYIKMRPYKFTADEIKRYSQLEIDEDWFCVDNCARQIYKADKLNLFSCYEFHDYIQLKIPVGPGVKVKKQNKFVGFEMDGKIQVFDKRKGTSTSYLSLGIFP